MVRVEVEHAEGATFMCVSRLRKETPGSCAVVVGSGGSVMLDAVTLDTSTGAEQSREREKSRRTRPKLHAMRSYKSVHSQVLTPRPYAK